MLLIFCRKRHFVGNVQELACVQYMKVNGGIVGVDETVSCVILRYAQEHKKDCTLDILKSLRGKYLDAEEYYRFVPFSSIVSSIHVLQLNIRIRPFTSHIPWKLHRF